MTVRSDIARMATKHPDVTLGKACAGTSLESTTYSVGAKAFLFVRATVDELRLKRASGWTKIAFAAGAPAELAAWIAESYALMAPSAAPKPARARPTRPRARASAARRPRR